MSHSVERELAGRTLRIETGKVAKQAGGAVWVTQGDTVVMAAATMSRETRQASIFFRSLVITRSANMPSARFPAAS